MRIGIASSRTASTCNLVVNENPETIGGSGVDFLAVTRPIMTDEDTLKANVNGILTTIHLEFLEPLFRNDLTSSERLSQQFILAVLVSFRYFAMLKHLLTRCAVARS